MKRLLKEREQDILSSVPEGVKLLGYPVRSINIERKFGLLGDYANQDTELRTPIDAYGNDMSYDGTFRVITNETIEDLVC